MAKKRNRDWVQDYFFLIVPKPLEDELLSSWLTRVAFSHKRPLSTFISLFLRHEGRAISRTDIDFLYDNTLFENIVQKSNLSKKEILRMSLRGEEGQLFICDENCLYPPLQIRKLTDKRTHNGLMYCPKCLEEDVIPYFRKKWRYNFYNGCPKHKIFLTDRCWRCYKKINLSKVKHLKELCICHKCEKDFRENIAVPIQSNYEYGLRAIKWFEKGLNRGYFKINKQKIKSVFVFESYRYFRYIINLFPQLEFKGFPLITEYNDICKQLQKYNSKKALSIKKEFILTSIVFHIFQNYPKNLILFAKQNEITFRNFTHGFKETSFWYKEMIYENIFKENKIGREVAKSEVLGAIRYLKNKSSIINQTNIAHILGCSPTKNTGYVKIYKELSVMIDKKE